MMTPTKDSFFHNGMMGSINYGYEPDYEIRRYVQNGVATLKVNTSAEKSTQQQQDAAAGGEDSAVPERGQWSNSLEFLMSCIAMSIGLGNVWRFPFTAYENGGGAFLIPYIIVLFLIGKPFYYLEMCLGQFSSYGPVKVWGIVPAFRGIGYGQMFATVNVLAYYCSLMALTVFYFVSSFESKLPWSYCREEWGPNCVDSIKSQNKTWNFTDTAQTSSELFFSKHVLKEVEDINDGIGVPDWKLTLCLLFSWFCVFLVVLKGVSSSGKASYFLAIFPYVIMITLLIKGCTLPGAANGILFFVTPQWEKLLDPSVWYAAVTQAFFSLNVGFGALIMYSSYNNFKANIYRDTLIITTLDTCTSMIAGCTIFAILGNLAHEVGTDDISKVVRSGTGLAFISYPDAIAKFESLPQLFAVLFFLMLFVLGVGCVVAAVNTIITVVKDHFPNTKTWLVAVSICVFSFGLGLLYVTPGGQLVLNLVDFYGVTFTIFILAAFEITGVAWIYGVNNFCNDVEFMQGRKVGIYWRLCWGIITPVLLLIVLIYFLISMEPLKYGDSYYPHICYVVGGLLIAAGISQLPAWMIHAFFRRKDQPFIQMITSSFNASDKWCPKKSNFFNEWRRFKEKRAKEDELISQSENIVQEFLRKFVGINFSRSNNIPER